MIDKATENAGKLGLGNVTFKHGDIEALPLADATVDVVMSNCVINLTPDKDAVFREAFRVLRPGGRLVVSDIVLTRPATEAEMQDMALLTGCISGSLPDSEYAEDGASRGLSGCDGRCRAAGGGDGRGAVLVQRNHLRLQGVGGAMTTVTVRSKGAAQYSVETAYGDFAAHEAPPTGDGAAPDPHSLLLAALGS